MYYRYLWILCVVTNVEKCRKKIQQSLQKSRNKCDNFGKIQPGMDPLQVHVNLNDGTSQYNLNCPGLGLHTFGAALEVDKNLKFSDAQLGLIMQKSPLYLTHIMKRRRFPRRKYRVPGRDRAVLISAPINYIYFNRFLPIMTSRSGRHVPVW